MPDDESVLDVVERIYGAAERDKIVAHLKRPIPPAPPNEFLTTEQLQQLALIRPAAMHCPWCGFRHLDVGEWETRPHHKHLCLNPACNKLFRIEGGEGEYFRGA